MPAIVSGVAGVTEPAIYGITLPKKKPFAITCVIGAITGGLLAATGAKYYIAPGMGVFGYTAFVNTVTGDFSGMIWAIIISVAALAAGVVLVYLTYKDEETKKKAVVAETEEIEADGNIVTAGNEAAAGKAEAGDNEAVSVSAPLAGKVIPLGEVADAAFSSGALGQGAAIVPAEGKLYAPMDGVVAAFFPTGHAVGIQTDDGVEILIHVGMDTVSLDGKGFDKKVNQGDHVKKGDLLLEFDLHIIEEAGLSAITPVIVTNPGGHSEIAHTQADTVKPGDDFLTVR